MCKGTEGRQRVRSREGERRERRRGRAGRRGEGATGAMHIVRRVVSRRVCGGGEHPQCTRGARILPTNSRTSAGSLSYIVSTLYPFVRPARRGKPVALRHPAGRVVSLRLSPVRSFLVSLHPSSLSPSFPRNLQLPSQTPILLSLPRIPPPALVCVYTALYSIYIYVYIRNTYVYIYTYIYMPRSRDARVTRESLSRIRAESPSSLRRAP